MMILITVMSSDNKHFPPSSDCRDAAPPSSHLSSATEGHSPRVQDHFVTRRQFLQRAGMGFGALSAAALFGEALFGASRANAIEQLASLTPREPHFPAKAKHVVHIFAQGAPSHVDTWDPKPALAQYD